MLEGRKLNRASVTVALLVLVGMIGLTASAAHSFLDVPDDHVFHGDIEWMKESGITRGCNPPENTEYCPDDYTTRGEMAAFFHRFANSRVVDAGTLEGKAAAEFLGADDKAADAEALDGLSSEEFVRTTDLGNVLADSLYVSSASESYLVGADIELSASCDEGDALISGGFDTDGLLGVNVVASGPDGNAWLVGGTATLAATVNVHAICLSV